MERGDRLAVQGARERPLQPEPGERDVVDRDEDHARRRLRAARLEAPVDRRVLERVERPAGVGDGGDGSRDEARGEQQPEPPGHRERAK